MRDLENSGQVAVGRLIADRYSVVRDIGVGGMSRVVEAVDTGAMRRRVALKVLRTSYLEQVDDETRRKRLRRFLNEATATAKVSSPHVITVYDVVEDRGLYYIVQEFVPGSQTVHDAMRQAHKEKAWLDELRVCDFLIQAALGLQAVHGAGVVHRDIKPSNMLLALGSDGVERLRLIDFGISKIENEQTTTLTGNRAVLGTPGYIAPETILGESLPFEGSEEGKPDHRSDFFSLGVSIFFALTYHLPFSPFDSADSLLYALTRGPPVLHNTRPELSVHWRVILNKLLVPYREIRYQAASDIVRDARILRELLEETDRGASELSMVPRVFGAKDSASQATPVRPSMSLSERALARAKTLHALGETMKGHEDSSLPSLAELEVNVELFERSSQEPMEFSATDSRIASPTELIGSSAMRARAEGIRLVLDNSILGRYMKDCELAQSESCTMPWLLAADGVQLQIVSGHVDLRFALEYVAATETAFSESSQRLTVFSDWSHATGYTAEARSYLTDWAMPIRENYEVAHLFVTRPLVAMGLTVANLAVKFFQIHNDSAAFEMVLESVLSQHRSST
ncbi:MAG: serine/threonine-protein kinase [Myxococcota bacterium]